MSDEKPLIISRRDLLKNVGLAGAAAAAAAGGAEALAPSSADAQVSRPAVQPQKSVLATPGPEALEHLTAAEGDLLDAMLARLIPSDALGPGAREARVIHYIDKALGGALANSRQSYAIGLASLDKYAQASRGKGFLELNAHDQDSVLIDVETGTAAGFTGSSAQFFTMVLGHTRQGMFGDPYYGGNQNFIGWDLLGYPGVRTNVRPEDQKAYEAGTLQPNHKSAYENVMFNKAVARLSPPGSGLSDHRHSTEQPVPSTHGGDDGNLA